MDESIKFFVGLDAHKDSIAVAVCEAGREPSRFVGTLGPDVQRVLKTLRKYGPARQVSVVYEAGPTGYGLHRKLTRHGYRCEIIAPSLIPRRAGERIKTDRRDCARLAELSRAGELKAICVPDEAHEAMRNRWRAREDALNMRLKVRQQLKALLLRQDRRYAGKTSWTKMHQRWIADQHFAHPADQITLTEDQLAVQAAEERVQRLTAVLQQRQSKAGASSRSWRRCGRCAASTPSAPSAWCARSETSAASARRASSWATLDSCLRSIPAATACGAARSPRPAMPTRGAC